RDVGPLQVLDASPTGLGIAPTGVYLAPGSQVDALEISYRSTVVWTGSAVAVYQTDAPHSRIGLRFTSGLFDTQRLRVSDSEMGDRMDRELELETRYTQMLPSDFRASVAAIRQLLQIARAVLDDAEASLSE